MADSAKRMYGPAQPGTGNATLYTAPSGGAIIRQLIVDNTTALAATVSLAINGTAATAANCFLSGLSLAAFSADFQPCFIPLAAGDTIQGLQGTASAITLTIGGIELG